MDNARIRVKSYWRQKHLLTLLSLIFSVLGLSLIYATGLSSGLASFAFSICANYYGALLIYLGVFSLIFGLIFFPLDLYGGYILEKKFSLSNQSLRAWFVDEAKGSLISFIFFAILIEAFYAIFNIFPHGWWIAASLFWITMSLVVAKIFPVFIIPLFYRYKPLAQEDLRRRALALARKFGIRVMDVFEIDFSAKTKKANAAIVGWGSGRRVILADNLINEFTPDEVEAVIAHEMAHHKLKHLWMLLLISALSIGIFFYLVSAVSVRMPNLLSIRGIGDFAIFPALYLFFVIFGAVMMPIQNSISRKLERDADAMALGMTMAKEPFISLMEKLADKNLSDQDPSRLIEIVFYNHPPIAKRIAMARTFDL